MSTSHRILVIVPAAARVAANAAALTIKADAGTTFRVPLNASGLPADAPTHYWASLQVSPEAFAAVQQLVPAFPGSLVEEYDLATQPGFPQTKIAALGLKTISRPLPGN